MTVIQRIGVAGGGTMGAGIAIVAARGGFPTVVYDTSADQHARADQQTRGFFERSVKLGRMTEAQMEEVIGRIVRTTDERDLAACDLIIEAIFENREAKHALYARLDAICPEHVIFASNTSTLSIAELAGGSGRQDRFVGMHFCLPAQLMKLIEVSPGLATSDETFRTAWAVAEKMGQKPVSTQDTPGFVLNYFLVPFHNDVIRLVEAGVAEPADIDRAIKAGMGYPLGPCQLLDMVGLDTQILLSEAFHGVTNDPRAACPPLLRRMVAAGRLGRKAGRGFYTYDGDKMFGA